MPTNPPQTSAFARVRSSVGCPSSLERVSKTNHPTRIRASLTFRIRPERLRLTQIQQFVVIACLTVTLLLFLLLTVIALVLLLNLLVTGAITSRRFQICGSVVRRVRTSRRIVALRSITDHSIRRTGLRCSSNSCSGPPGPALTVSRAVIVAWPPLSVKTGSRKRCSKQFSAKRASESRCRSAALARVSAPAFRSSGAADLYRIAV